MDTRALIVDGDPVLRRSVTRRLTTDGLTTVGAGTGRKAMEIFEAGVDVVLVDDPLPDIDGLDLLRAMHASHPDVPLIMFTGDSGVERAVSAMKIGAFHYVCKPVEPEQLAVTVRRALETTRARREIRALRAERESSSPLASIIGTSPPMQKIKQLIVRVADSPSTTALLTGESGTGKNLVARAIHAQSARAGAPFVNITCSALPGQLLESELFGHERGAFTDAKCRKVGLLECAEHGTAFLDEIGEVEPRMQVKLLRFLEDRTFRRVGSTTDITADVRVVAATNRDLMDDVKRGAFRQDLYYRLAVLTIRVPPLRERGSDIDLLASVFVDKFCRVFDKRVAGISASALELLRGHPWPGNVRELRNAVERAVLLCEDGAELTRDDFTLVEEPAESQVVFRLPPGGVDVRELEKSLVEQALERAGGNQTRAAALLGMNRDQIRYRIERYGLHGPSLAHRSGS